LKTLALLPYTQAGSHRAARADAAMASNGHSSAGTPARRSLRLFALASAALSLVACGTSSSSRPQVGAIAFTDANGNALPAVTALNAGSGAYLEVLVTQDPQMLGVNWSVSCSSKLPPGTPLPPGQTVDESCGFFTPVHTASGPVPSYATSGAGIVTFYQAPLAQPKSGSVTLYASATSDPAQYTQITLSILP
jgi:hypothetical protein